MPAFIYSAKYDDYKNYPDFERRSEATGVDIALERGEDILVDQGGDLALNGGARMVMEALTRRVSTSDTAYRRWVRIYGGLELVDADYGTQAYQLHSLPLTQRLIDRLNESVAATASREVRIENVLVSTSSKVSDRAATVDIGYRIKGNANLEKATLELRPLANGSLVIDLI